MALGRGAGDLKDTTGLVPALSLGLRWECSLPGTQVLRLRLDQTAFDGEHRVFSGTQGSTGWVRTINTNLVAVSLGAEDLIHPFKALPNLSFGVGAHLVHWQMNTTDSTAFNLGAGTSTTHTSSPTWNRLGVSLVVDVQLNRTMAMEGRYLVSSYGWQGERAPLAQLGLLWRP